MATTTLARAAAMSLVLIGCRSERTADDAWSGTAAAADSSSDASGPTDDDEGVGEGAGTSSEGGGGSTSSGAVPGSSDGPGGESSGPDDPTSPDDAPEHGEGMCGGGFGHPEDLAHVPLCPSNPLRLQLGLV
jgi:hypothetical protein